MQAYPARTGRGDRKLCNAIITIGAAGAVSSIVADDPAFTAANAGAGLFSLTFPKCVRAYITALLVSPASTVKQVYLTALNASAGTATLGTSSGAGAATNPASGDLILLSYDLDTTVGI